MFPKFSVVVSRFRCQSPDGRHFAFNMGFFDNTEHGTCAELGEFSTHNPTHKMLDAVEVRSSSLLVPTIFLHHLASLTSLRKAPNGSIKRADPEGMMFRTSSNPTSGEFWAAHFYGTGVIRQVDTTRTSREQSPRMIAFATEREREVTRYSVWSTRSICLFWACV